MKWKHWIAMLAWAVLAGSGWLRDEVLPLALPGFERRAVEFFVVFFVALFLCRGRVAWWWGSLCGVGLFLVPDLARMLPVPSLTQMALMGLVPVFTVVCAPYVLGEESGSSLKMLPLALCGVAGLFLLLPADVPATWMSFASFVGFCGCFVVVSWVGVHVWRGRKRVDVAGTLAGCCGPLAGCYALLSFFFEKPVFGWRILAPATLGGVVVELPMLLIFFWMLREVDARRFSARFLFVPLVGLAEGWFFVRPVISLRMGFGILFLAVGAVAVFGWRAREDVPLKVTSE